MPYALLMAGSCVMAWLVSSAVHAAETFDDDTRLEEVVITAEKREVNLQKTAQTVSVINGEKLRASAVTQVKDLQTLVAGVSINPNGQNGNEISIRGVSGLSGGDPSNQPAVAMLVDGVYSQSGIAGSGALFDMQQVEVVKGPQGTLIGRNATAGAVSLVTQRPRQENSGRASINIGNYAITTATGVVNLALTDRLALRTSGQSSRHEGFYRDGFSDENTQGGRVKLQFQADENVSFTLSADYSQQKGRGSGTSIVYTATGKPVGGNAWAAINDPVWFNDTLTPRQYRSYGRLYGQDAKQNNSSWGVSPELQWNLGHSTLTALGSYKKTVVDKVSELFTGDHQSSAEKSLELRLTSNDEQARLSWQVGLYYYAQDLTTRMVTINALNFDTAAGTILTSGDAEVNFNGGLNLRNVPEFVSSSSQSGCEQSFSDGTLCAGHYNDGRRNTETNYALFTQNTYAVIKPVRVTVGARWQREEAGRSKSYDRYFLADGSIGNAIESSTTSSNHPRHWDAVTGKLGVDVDVSAGVMAYALVSTGWKAGTPQQYDPPYDQQRPEKLTAYSIGAKSRMLGDRLQLNGELYYWHYRDRQVSLTCVPVTINQQQINDSLCSGSSGGAAFVQANAPRSHIQGASLDFSYRVFLSDLVTLNVEYINEALHDDMGDYSQLGVTCRAHCRVSRTPRWSSVLAWRHDIDLGAKGFLSVDARSKFESTQTLDILDRNLTAADEPNLFQKTYHRSSLGLSYVPDNAKWTVRGYVDNIENGLVKDFSTGSISSSTSSNSGTTGTSQYLNPRTYGVQLTADF